jgi:hypothetical protein
MAFLYQPPRLPYSGTELGLGSNVFCENLSMIAGSGAAKTEAGVQVTYDNTGGTALSQAGTTNSAVASSSTTSVNGTGMTAKFTVTPAAGIQGNLSLSIENPGTGYKVGDKITFAKEDILTAINAGTTPPVEIDGAGRSVSANVVFVLLADQDLGVTDKSYIVGYSADDNTTEGWQFLLKGPSGIFQRIVISAPSRKASTDPFTNLERTTTVYANATSTDNAAVPDTQLGGACSTAISRNGNTHINVTVVRFVPTGFTLADCAMTVRLGDRQLAMTD